LKKLDEPRRGQEGGPRRNLEARRMSQEGIRRTTTVMGVIMMHGVQAEVAAV
jgi:hypothetical protein